MSRADGPHHDEPGPVFPDDVVAGGELLPEGRSPLIRTLLTALVTIVVIGVLIGVFLLVVKLMTSTEEQASRIPLTSAQVSVDARSADIRFVAGKGDALVIRSKVTHGPFDGSYAALINKREHIVIDDGCRAIVSPTCKVQVTMEVPAGYPVEVTTTSGDVSAKGLADRVLTVRTESGDVTGSALAVTELSVRSDSGQVDAAFAKEPFALKVRTGSGDVSAQVPSGSVRYQVQVRSGSGDVKNALDDVAGGNGLVVVRTGSGDIDLGRS